MSYDENDPDLLNLEIINPAVSEHPSDIVTNVRYGGMNKKTAKKAADRDEQFYKWVKSLNANSDGVSRETHHFQYTKREYKR